MKRERIYGRQSVLECLRARRRRAHRLYLLQDARGVEAILEAAASVPLEQCGRRDLDRITDDGTHQGVVLEVDPLPVANADSWDPSRLPQEAIVVVLDGVEDPHNFGAIARSACAFGAHALVFGKDRAAPLSAVACKSAAGALEHLTLIQATNLVRAIDRLKEADFWVYALDADADNILWRVDLLKRVAIVIGAEGKGIRRLVREHCDAAVSIPLAGPIPSLNASTAAAIALAEIVRQRSG